MERLKGYCMDCDLSVRRESGLYCKRTHRKHKDKSTCSCFVPVSRKRVIISLDIEHKPPMSVATMTAKQASIFGMFTGVCVSKPSSYSAIYAADAIRCTQFTERNEKWITESFGKDVWDGVIEARDKIISAWDIHRNKHLNNNCKLISSIQEE